MSKHGAPDWSKYRTLSTSFSLQDLAELAVRLGSPVSFDRRGDVLWLDTFEQGKQAWETHTGGSGSTLTVGISHALTGTYSLQMTAGSTDPWDITATHHIAALVSGALGFEVSFTLGTDTGYIEIDLEYWDGAVYHHGLLSYRKDLATIQYLDANNTQQTLTTCVEFFDTPWRFHTMKLVIDFSTNKYIRCLLDDNEHDMSTLPCYAPTNTDPDDFKAKIIHHGTSGTNAVLYVDNVIITQDEP